MAASKALRKKRARNRRIKSQGKAAAPARFTIVTVDIDDGRRVIDRAAERAIAARDDHTNAVARRARQTGLAKRDAVRAEAGSIVGRLKLAGELTPQQHDTAVNIGETLFAWCSASTIEQPSPKAIDYIGGAGGLSCDIDDDERAISLNAKVTKMRDAVFAKVSDPHLAWKDVETVCWMDRPPHNVARLRAALDVLGGG